MKKSRFFYVAGAVTLAIVGIFGTKPNKPAKALTSGEVYFSFDGSTFQTLNSSIPTFLTWNKNTTRPTAFFKTIGGTQATLLTNNSGTLHKLYYKG